MEDGDVIEVSRTTRVYNSCCKYAILLMDFLEAMVAACTRRSTRHFYVFEFFTLMIRLCSSNKEEGVWDSNEHFRVIGRCSFNYINIIKKEIIKFITSYNKRMV